MNKKLILSVGMIVLSVLALASCKTTHDHKYDGYSHDANQHWQVCTVDGCNETINKEDHRGGTATETELAKCEVCGESYGSLKAHEHAFTISKVDAIYLVSEADCDSPATYYKSCACGEKGSETFTSGEAKGHTFTEWATKTPADCLNAEVEERSCACGHKETRTGDAALGHSYGSSYEKDGTHHWQVCTRDGCEVTSEKVAHSGGTATETSKAKCEVCDGEYGSVLPHDHVYLEVVAGKYLKSAADCENKAVYYKSCACGEAHETETFVVGEALGHNYGNEIPEVAPVCGTPGTLAHYECSRCEKLFTKSGETYTEVSSSDLVIAPTSTHAWGYNNLALDSFPNATGNGVIKLACSNCEEVYNLEIANYMFNIDIQTYEEGAKIKVVLSLREDQIAGLVEANPTLDATSLTQALTAYKEDCKITDIGYDYVIYRNGDLSGVEKATNNVDNLLELELNLSLDDKVTFYNKDGLIKFGTTGNIPNQSVYTASKEGVHKFYLSRDGGLYVVEPTPEVAANYNLYLNDVLNEASKVSPSNATDLAQFEIVLAIGDVITIKGDEEVIETFEAVREGKHIVYVNEKGEVYITQPAIESSMKTYYLVPNANWKQSNARFAVYAFGGSIGDKWIDMVDSNKDGIYEVEIDVNNYATIIFCRMNPSVAANNWNNKWNQSEDIVLANICGDTYTVKAGSWDKEGSFNHVYTLVNEVPSTCTVKGTAEHYTCPCEKLYTKAGEVYTETTLSNLELPLATTHEEEAVWSKDATTHTKTYPCCGVVEVATESHEWENGVCSECEYVCEHTGISTYPTCKEKAVCSICGEKHGELDSSNHEGVAKWTTTEDTHSQAYDCCGLVVVEEEAHDMVEGTCSECGYSSQHFGGTATCKSLAICEHCGEPWGALDPNNHEGTTKLVEKDGTYHEVKYDCCGHVVSTVAHVLDFDHSDSKHWTVCECGYKTSEVDHDNETKADATGHWEECECGYKSAVVPHDTKEASCEGEVKCSCGWKLHDALEHSYEYNYVNGAISCENCAYEGTLVKEATWVIKSNILDASWGKDINFFVHPTEANIIAVALELEAKTYSFKMNDGNWYGNWKQKAPTNSFQGTFAKENNADAKITISKAGKYVFVFNKSSKSLVIAPDSADAVVGLMGSFNSWASDKEMEYQGNGVWTASMNLPASTKVEFKVRYDKSWDNAGVGLNLTDGNITYTPSKAGEYLFTYDLYAGSIKVELVNHTYGTLVEGYAATCTTDGQVAHYVCSHCNKYFNETFEEISTIVIPAAHTGEAVWVATSDKELTHKKAYSCCGEVVVEEEAHTYENGVCSECGFTCEHSKTPIVLEGKEATCTEKGLTEGSKCPTCEKILVEQKEIDALNHDISVPQKDDTHHWNKCVRCDVISEKEVHVYTYAYVNNEGTLNYVGTCECGHIVSEEVEEKEVEVSNEADLRNVLASGHNAILSSDIDLALTIEVTNTVVVDLNGHTLTARNEPQGYGIFKVQTGGNLTINGEGKLDSCGNNAYSIAVWARGGKVTINGGTYTNVGAHSENDGNHFDLIYVSAGGEIVINGGTFINETPRWTLNHNNGSQGTILVNGGKFYNFDPSNDQTDDKPESTLVGEGKCVVKVEDYYVVDSHVVVTDKAVDPDCVNTGLTEGSHCSRCNHVFKAQETVDALGHKNEIKQDADYHWNECSVCQNVSNKEEHTGGVPTETEPGVCTVCNREYIQALGHQHNLVHVEAQNPTCIEDGHIEYYYCDKGTCEDKFIDAEGLNKVTEDELVIEALNHDISVPQKDDTHHWNKCVRCDVISEKEAHVYTYAYVNNEGTLNYVGTCECTHVVSNEVEEKEVEVSTANDLIAVLTSGHNAKLGASIALDGAIVIANKVEVNLNNMSLTLTEKDTEGDGVFCVVENGHLTINGEGTVNGVGNNTYNMALYAKGGTIVINGGTYTNVGCQENDPGSDHFDLIYVKYGGHVEINGGTFINETPVWTLNSNDKEKGTFTVKGGKFFEYNPADNTTENPTKVWVEEGYCAVEDANKYYVVDSHVVVTDKAVAPDCVNTGLTEGSHCSRCNKVLVAQEVVDATGHDYELVEASDPTCVSSGNHEHYICKNKCGDIFIKDGEKYVVTTEKEITISATGIHTGGTATCKTLKTCTTCGTSYGELDSSNHESTTEAYVSIDSKNHKVIYSCCGGTKVDSQAHSGGTAQPGQQANCEKCGTAYGEKAPYKYTVSMNWNGFSDNAKIYAWVWGGTGVTATWIECKREGTTNKLYFETTVSNYTHCIPMRYPSTQTSGGWNGAWNRGSSSSSSQKDIQFTNYSATGYWVNP